MIMGYPLGLIDAMADTIREETRARERAERKARARRGRR